MIHQHKIFLRYLAIVTVIAVVASGCTNPFSDDDDDDDDAFRGGYVLSFDDAYVREWYDQRDIFEEYGVSATFFVVRFAQMTPGQIDMLKELERDGHEIGCHSLSHINALEYAAAHSAAEYANVEVVPALDIMKDHGFDVGSFAFPFGANNDEINTEVLKYVQVIRDVTDVQRTARTKRVHEIEEIFYSPGDGPVVYGLGIDKVFDIPLDEIEEAFRRAQENSEVVVFYAHRPVETAEGSYEIERSYLEGIFQLAQAYKMKSLTISEIPFK